MGFTIPWRCLIPVDAVESIFGADGGTTISNESGAGVSISTEDEAPQTLSDKIVTISGSVEEKEKACHFIMKDLWTSQGIGSDEDGIFVLIVPSNYVGAIIGPKGVKIKEIMQTSGADINVGREAIIGMPDNPMVVNGSQSQVTKAALMAMAVLQEFADRDKISQDDFKYIPGRSATPRPPSRAGSGPAARFIVPKGVTGYIIGRGGEKIRNMKEQTGAYIQIRGNDDEPNTGLTEEERSLEIRGDPESRAQGVKAVFVEMDQMPDPPNDVRMLVPSIVPITASDFANGAEVEVSVDSAVRGSGAQQEKVVVISGPVFPRLKVVFSILTLMDEEIGARGSSESPPIQASSKPNSGGLSSVQTTSPREAVSGGSGESAPIQASSKPNSGGLSSPQTNTPREVVSENSVEELRREPETGKVFTFIQFKSEFRNIYTDTEIRDYWRDACTCVPNEKTTMNSPAVPGAAVGYGQSSNLESVASPHKEFPEAKPGANGIDHVGPAHVQRCSLLASSGNGMEEPGPSAAGMPSSMGPLARQQNEIDHSLATKPTLVQSHGVGHVSDDGVRESFDRCADDFKACKSDSEATQPTCSVTHPMSNTVANSAVRKDDVPNCSRESNPILSQPGPSTRSFAVDTNGKETCTLPPIPSAFGGVGMCAWPQASFFNFAPKMHSTLVLLLRKRLVQEHLVPAGHLQDIACSCNVRIDLDAGASQDDICLVLSGTPADNALAALLLQWRIWFASA